MPRLFTLGLFELRASDGTGAPLPAQPKRLALLAYLALAEPRGFHRRDALLALFWPDSSQDEARNALRQALHYLRQYLGDEVLETRADDRIGLVAGSFWCDASALEQAVAAGDDAGAVSLYPGPFLDAVFVRGVASEFEEWAAQTRVRLRTAASQAAGRLAEREWRAGRAAEAVAAARRRIEIEPDNEAAWRTLIGWLDDGGGRAEALAEADRLRELLRQRHGAPPSPETAALIDAIRSGSREPAPVPGSRSATELDPVAPAPIAVGDRTGISGEPGAPEPAGRPTGRRRPLAAALVTLGIAAAIWAGLRLGAGEAPPPGPSAGPDRVLVVDFVDRTPARTLGSLVAGALRVDLAQSTRVRVLTAAQTRAAVKLLDRPVEVTIDDSLARAIAVREGLKGFVTGEVQPLGSSFVLTARLVSVPAGDQLAAARETARDSTDLIGAIERLSRSLRHRIGESLAQVSRSLPLSRVTTGSLAALEKYSEGLRLLDQGLRAEGVAQLEQAVAIDSGFATAQRILGATYGVLGEPARAANALEAAFRNRNRLPFRERQLLMGSYYRNATGEYQLAAAAYRALLEVDPNDIAALNNLGLTLTSLGSYPAAESLFVRVVAADSNQVNARLVLAEAQAMQGRFAAAQATMAETARRFPDHPTVPLTRIYVAAAASDWPEAERLAGARLALVTATIQRIDALQTLGEIEAIRGRLRAAQEHLEESMRLARTAASPRKYWWAAAVLASIEGRDRGQPAAARQLVRRARAAFPPGSLAAGDLPVAQVAAGLGAAATARELRELFASAGADAAERDWGAAFVAAAEERWSDAAVGFAGLAGPAQECAICALPELANAQEQLGQADAALATAERYLATPFIHRFEPDALYLAQVLRQVVRLRQRRNEPDLAEAAYRRLVQFRSQADSDVVGGLASAPR
ncbi:MAG: BTAD domain-containing putative transcriptional regulator [Gemmatimonadales bacterium]